MLSRIQIQTGFLKFTHELATARVTLWNDGVAYISGVYSRKRGQGHASQVMKDICEMADTNGLILQLDVSSYGPDNQYKLTDEQLQEWYSKFGFGVVPDGGLPILMERLPQDLQPL